VAARETLVTRLADEADPVAEEALDRALDDTAQLVLAYQPIHVATTGVIYAAEALLRQRREDGGLREASIITETAEAKGGPDLYELDEVLINRAYVDAAQWHAAGFPDVRLNINLSPREFQDGRVVERLNSLLSACHLDTSKVSLEITETYYIEHPKETMEVLKALDHLGLELWLDDFGTGHSSLQHVQHFPLDGLKVPGEFVKSVPHDKRCNAIVRATIALAHDLGLQVIAEGVERREQLDFLLNLRCHYIQGFLFSKPMPTEAFQATLAGRSSGQ
jgi:EAL domain-containing protein (putative c-di-GMP-specific phosphodiesterase class I)